MEGIVLREKSLKTHVTRQKKICFLEDNQRDNISKQILQAISGMAATIAYMAMLVAAFVVVCTGVPLSWSVSDSDQALIQKTQSWSKAHTGVMEGIVLREKSLKTRVARQKKICFLEDHQRDNISKQILQAISELMNKEGCFGDHPLSDRDYQGWMDFGRRSAENYKLE